MSWSPVSDFRNMTTSEGIPMSIKKIAEQAGVSISTVSRILNRPDYKCSIPGLREKVWAIAMKMDYVPNEAARNLKKGKQSRDSRIWYILMRTTPGNIPRKLRLPSVNWRKSIPQPAPSPRKIPSTRQRPWKQPSNYRAVSEDIVLCGSTLSMCL